MQTTSIPVCDIAALRTGSARQQARVVLDIGAAARSVGCFVIADHGIPEIVSHHAFAAARRFFALPPNDKDRLAADALGAYRGYARASAAPADAAANAHESFSLGRDLAPDDPEVAAGTPFVGFNRWPELAGFREPSLAYFKAMNALATVVQRAFALDLSMPPDFFSRFCDRPLTTLRLLRYASTDGPGAAQSDWGIFTLLAQDEASGLELQTRDGDWRAADVAPGALMCVVGDCLTRWSNDRYTSRPYRIVNPGGYALALCADPNPDTLIACLPTCQDEDDPARYAPISYAAYAQERQAATMLAGAL